MNRKECESLHPYSLYIYLVYIYSVHFYFNIFFSLYRDNEMKDLSRLLELLNTPASKQQVHCNCNLLTGEHLRVHENLSKHVCFPDWIGIWKCWFLRRKKNPSEQLGREQTTNSTHIMALTPRFKPGPHWWEESALTTATPLLLMYMYLYNWDTLP